MEAKRGHAFTECLVANKLVAVPSKVEVLLPARLALGERFVTIPFSDFLALAMAGAVDALGLGCVAKPATKAHGNLA